MTDDELRSALEAAGWNRVYLSQPFGMSGAMYRLEEDDPDGVEVWVPAQREAGRD